MWLIITVDGKKPVSIILHAVPQSGVFKLNRFHINKNNVRPAWFKGQGHTQEQMEQGID